MEGQADVSHVGVGGGREISVRLLHRHVYDCAGAVVDVGDEFGGELVVAIGRGRDVDVFCVGGDVDGVAAVGAFDLLLGGGVGIDDISICNVGFGGVANGKDLQLEQDFGGVGRAAHHGIAEGIGSGVGCCG